MVRFVILVSRYSNKCDNIGQTLPRIYADLQPQFCKVVIGFIVLSLTILQLNLHTIIVE
jgi:hypothetical protein